MEDAGTDWVLGGEAGRVCGRAASCLSSGAMEMYWAWMNDDVRDWEADIAAQSLGTDSILLASSPTISR